jgi:sterol desaturase/sphingolipid hydroxylase (fatty acid hydroxylase superfamily)/predicted lipoprotein
MGALLDVLLEPADALFHPSKRVFFPFLLVAGLIAAATLVSRGVASRRVAQRLFDRRVWLHRSALVDYKLIALKALVRAALFGTGTVSVLGVASLVCGWLRRHVGATPLPPMSLLTAGALFTLAAFLVEDFSRFTLHLAMHRVPLLWEFHKVHHAAEVMTPFTLYRTHPVEALLNDVRGALAIGGITGLGAWALGPSVRGWEVLGVDAIGFVWSLAGANLRHSHIWLSYGPILERLFLSPAQHQIHHSVDPRHHDRNFGTILAIWDWLAGSLYATRRRPEPLRFGLPEGEAPARAGALVMLLEPFVGAARQLRPRAAFLVLVAAAALSVGCSSKSKLDRGALLSAMGRNTLDVYRKFTTDAAALEQATQALATTPTAAARTAAQAAWKQAMATWEEIELLRYGPLAAPSDTPGGQALRDPIYSWPLVTRCLIEKAIVAESYRGGVDALGVDVRGLAAMEYLLFYGGSDHQCGSADPINAGWSALSADELARRKAAYAHALAADVATRSTALVQTWEPNGFLAQLETAGRGSTLFPTQLLAVNTVAAALFHLDEVKDRKLAIPLGLKDCPPESCTSDPESPWAGAGKQHLAANLRGLRLLLEGAPPPATGSTTLGFDDYLDAVGASTVTTQMRADLATADAAVQALPDAPLTETLATQSAALQSVYEAVKALTDFLKMEFTVALSITPPTRVEGDHD